MSGAVIIRFSYAANPRFFLSADEALVQLLAAFPICRQEELLRKLGLVADLGKETVNAGHGL